MKLLNPIKNLAPWHLGMTRVLPRISSAIYPGAAVRCNRPVDAVGEDRCSVFFIPRLYGRSLIARQDPLSLSIFTPRG